LVCFSLLFCPRGGSHPPLSPRRGVTSALPPADTIDIVRDPISPGEYKPEEDPKLYHSAKTGRGPLGDDWLEAAAAGPLMCAYKLCKVEFRYWGMQSKIEQFIHDVGESPAAGTLASLGAGGLVWGPPGPCRARSRPVPVAGLRKVMLRAHRQAWCWQDEWTDLTMEDIRQLEEETARMLAQKMAKCGEAEEPPTAGPSPEGRPEPGGASGQEGPEAQGVADASPDDSFAKQWSTSSRSSYSSQHGGEGLHPGWVGWGPPAPRLLLFSIGDASGDPLFLGLGLPGVALGLLGGSGCPGGGPGSLGGVLVPRGWPWVSQGWPWFSWGGSGSPRGSPGSLGGVWVPRGWPWVSWGGLGAPRVALGLLGWPWVSWEGSGCPGGGPGSPRGVWVSWGWPWVSWEGSGCPGGGPGSLGGVWVSRGWPWVSRGGLGGGTRGSCGAGAGSRCGGALGADPMPVAGGVSPQSLSEWRMQNIARDSENSSEEEFFDAHGTAQRFGGRDQAPARDALGGGALVGLPTHDPLPATAEDLSDSDEVFAKEMTKWSSNDFLDTLERPAELDEALGERLGGGPAPDPSVGVLGGGRPPAGLTVATCSQGMEPAPPRWMAKDWGSLASLRWVSRSSPPSGRGPRRGCRRQRSPSRRAARRRARCRRAGSTPSSSSSTAATSWTRERASRAPSRRTCRRWRPPSTPSPASTSPRRWATWRCASSPARPSAPPPTPSSPGMPRGEEGAVRTGDHPRAVGGERGGGGLGDVPSPGVAPGTERWDGDNSWCGTPGRASVARWGGDAGTAPFILPAVSLAGSAPTATTGTACPAARTTSRWQPSRCWPPPRGATSTPWVPSSPVPTRPTAPSSTPAKGPASAAR